METKDKEKTAIVVDNNLYHFNRMPQGLSTSSNKFCKLMQFIFGDIIGSKVLVYLDDLIVFSNTFEEHLVNLREVFNRLKHAGLKLKPAKFNFFKEVEYLGHIISEKGIAPDEKKTEKITNFPVPRNVKELRGFIGLCSYYRKFVAQFATIAEPLTRLAKKDVTFIWDEQAQTAFDELKLFLTSKPILAFADFSKRFLLFCDASNSGIYSITGSERKRRSYLLC